MNQLRQRLEAICRRHGVADLYAFGSRGDEVRARLDGLTAHPGHSGSDLDLGVRFLSPFARRGPNRGTKRSPGHPDAQLDAHPGRTDPARARETFVTQAVQQCGGGCFDPFAFIERLDNAISLAGELEDLLGLGRVDLVDVARAEAFVAANILRGDLLWSSDEYDQAEFELYVLRRAGDLVRFKRQEMAVNLDGEPS